MVLEKIIGSTLKILKVPLMATAMTAASFGLFHGCEKPDEAKDNPPDVKPPVENPKPAPKLKDYGHMFFYGQYDSVSTIDVANLYISKSDGSSIRKLADSIEFFTKLKSSPDGTKIAYYRSPDHIILDTAGIEIGRFKGLMFSYEDFTWTPDSKSVLFSGYTRGIYKYDVDSKQTKVIHATDCFCYDHNPVKNPFDDKIAFVHHEYGSIYYIYTMESNGDSLKLVDSGSPTYHDDEMQLTWIDKNHLLYINEKENKMYNLNTDTKERTEIVTDKGHLNYPELSPDGRNLALLKSDVWNRISFLDVGQLAGGHVTPRDSKIPVSEYLYPSFAWSPDSKYVVSGDNNVVRIYDMNDKEYSFLKKNDFKEPFVRLLAIRWTH